MKKSPKRIDLWGVSNWAELAALVNYQPDLLASHWKIHRRTLEREFRRQFNVTPQKHLDRVRLLEAQALARQQVRVKEISNRLGYKHVSHLCRQAQTFFGVTLGAFRRSSN